MRLVRYTFFVVCCTVIALGVVAGGSGNVVSAQGGGQCTPASADDLKTAKDACAQAGLNSACLALDSAQASLTTDDAFTKQGDQVDLAKVTSLTTAAASDVSANGGIVSLKLQAGLPDGNSEVTALLYGASRLTANVAPSASATADAAATAATAEASSGSTNQTFTLVTGGVPTADKLPTKAPACGVPPSGLLIQSSSDKTAKLTIDGAEISFTSATLVIRATPNDRLEVANISGKVTVLALGKSQDLTDGQSARIRIGGKDGITITAPPPIPVSYAFAVVDSAPFSMLTTSMSCVVGLPSAATKTAVRVGPGEERGSLFFLDANNHFTVNGKANDAKGLPWWKIDAAGKSQAWVAQAAVHSIGNCDQVADAPPPPVIVAVPSGDNAEAGGTPDASFDPGFVPTTRTIWQADPGPISQTGACTSVPVAYCPQLLSLTPKGTGLLWKGQELQPYYMSRVRTNVYAYAGPNGLGDARITLTLVFSSTTSFKATQTMVMIDQPACQSSFTFSGAFVR